MKIFEPEYKYISDKSDGILVAVDEASLASFDVKLLNLGELRKPSKPIDALSAFFDLEGFTDFTRQVDPQLTVPVFISDFLEWLFSQIKKAFLHDKETKTLWAELPFFSKFMGDGVMFLWKLELDKIVGMDPDRPADKIQYEIQEFICNIVSSLYDINLSYNKFYNSLVSKFVNPPERLRCGIARGIVIPIGRGSDFVGPCINIAARLQKFYRLSFAFSARGIDDMGFANQYRESFVKKRSNIRGLGKNELVYVIKEEFDELPPEDMEQLKEP